LGDMIPELLSLLEPDSLSQLRVVSKISLVYQNAIPRLLARLGPWPPGRDVRIVGAIVRHQALWLRRNPLARNAHAALTAGAGLRVASR